MPVELPTQTLPAAASMRSLSAQSSDWGAGGAGADVDLDLSFSCGLSQSLSLSLSLCRSRSAQCGSVRFWSPTLSASRGYIAECSSLLMLRLTNPISHKYQCVSLSLCLPLGLSSCACEKLNSRRHTSEICCAKTIKKEIKNKDKCSQKKSKKHKKEIFK